MSLIALKFLPGAEKPEIISLQESIAQVQAAVGKGLNIRTVRIGSYRMVLIASSGAASKQPVNRIYEGKPIHGAFMLCGDGKGASIVSIPLQLLGYMKHASAEAFRLPEQAHAQSV